MSSVAFHNVCVGSSVESALFLISNVTASNRGHNATFPEFESVSSFSIACWCQIRNT